MASVIKTTLLTAVLAVAFAANSLAQHELPLPGVPAELRRPQDRAEYIIAHFWDGMDFADTQRSHSRAFMEQNMVNWFSLFPHAPENKLGGLITLFLTQAAADSTAFRLAVDIAEEYLYTPHSPMKNDAHFILFYEQVLKGNWLGEAERVRPAGLLETARKNRPGTKATDFRYIVRTNAGQAQDAGRDQVHTLHKTEGENLLLLFYSPDCHYCKVVTGELRRSATIQKLIDSRRLTVLAIYADGDRRLWDATKASYPASWIVGFDTGDIIGKDLYSMPSMPVMYLLDSNKKVVLKETTYNRLDETLRGMY